MRTIAIAIAAVIIAGCGNGTASPDVSADQALLDAVHEQQDGPPNQWYSPDNVYSECVTVKRGPGIVMDVYGGTLGPRVQEFSTAKGFVWKVIVSANLDGTQSSWTFYRSKVVCNAEEILARKALADRYR